MQHVYSKQALLAVLSKNKGSNIYHQIEQEYDVETDTMTECFLITAPGFTGSLGLSTIGNDNIFVNIPASPYGDSLRSVIVDTLGLSLRPLHP